MISAPFRTRQLAWLVSAALAAAGNAAAAPAGNVDFAIGGVSVTGADGRARPAAKGQEIQSGDRIVTTDGRAQIRFTDGAYVSLQPNTDFSIRDYQYTGRTDGTEKGIFGLVRGALRTVTGAIGRVNRGAYQIQTPTATIGIRGTGGLIQVLNDGTTRIVGTSGTWSLTNPAGTVSVPAGQAAAAGPDPKEPPKETAEGPVVPAPPTGPLEVALLPPKEGPGYGAVPPAAPPAPSISGNAVTSDGVQVPIADEVKRLSATSTTTPTPPPPPPPPQLVDGTYDAYQQVGVSPFPNQANPYPGASVTFGAAGEALTIGPSTLIAGTVYEINNMSPVAWGRWTGTNVSAPPLTGGPVAQDQGVHYVLGIPTPVALLPTTGIVNFTFLGATNPTRDDGTGVPGSFQSGQLGVDFMTGKIGINFNLVFSNFSYAVTTAGGGALNPSASQVMIQGGTSSFAGTGIQVTPAVPFGPQPTTCSIGCQMDVKGGFFGPAGADYAGFVYGSGQSGVSGAAVFKK